MAQDKRSIVVYSDWIKKFEAITDEEAGKLIKHFFRYVNDLNPTAPDRITELLFIDIEQSLKRDLIKWEKRAERSRENGKSGGRPPLQENLEKPNETQQVIFEPGKPVNVNVNVNDIVNDNVIKTNSIVADFPSKKSATQTLKDTFDLRKAEFRKTLIPFTKTSKNPLGKFDGEMVKEFFEKWTEPNKSRSKMKFEIEQTWDVELRLGTWKRNDFGKKNGFNKNQQSLTEHLPYLNKIDHSNRED